MTSEQAREVFRVVEVGRNLPNLIDGEALPTVIARTSWKKAWFTPYDKRKLEPEQ